MRKSRKLAKTSKETKEPTPDPVDQIRPHAGPLLDALTGLDPKRGRIAAEEILNRAAIPFWLGAIVDLAVERLVCVEDADRGDVVDGLCRLGQPAVVHLVYHLGHSKGERARVRLVEALAAIGQNLSPLEALNLMMTLTTRVEVDPSKRVWDACAQAIAALRRVASPRRQNESTAG
jgi:hypothetical protein